MSHRHRAARFAPAPFALAALLLVPIAGYGQGAPNPDAPPIEDAGRVLALEPLGTVSPERVQREATPMFGAFGPPIIENPVDAYRVRYLTTDLDGSAAEIVAQLFVPRLETPAPLPLYVFGSGTTGLADVCAPSREAAYDRPFGFYRQYLQAYAGRGFVAIIPDYLGFDDDPERVQTYFNAVGEARVMLDAARAVANLFAQGALGEVSSAGATLSGEVFVGGYSQGGHAAFAAADLAPVYAPEVGLAGVIGYGATTNVERLLRDGPYYAPYIVASYRQAYGSEAVDPAAILAEPWVATLEQDVRRLCVDRAQSYYPFSRNLYAPAFAAALYAERLEQAFPTFARLLDANRTGLSGHGLPALVVQGDDDVIATNPTQELFVRELCDAGSEVLYQTYPGVRHRFTRPAGFEASIAWMKGVMQGEPAPSSCGSLPGRD